MFFVLAGFVLAGFISAMFVPAIFVLAVVVLAVGPRGNEATAGPLASAAKVKFLMFSPLRQQGNGWATGFGGKSKIPYVFPFEATRHQRNGGATGFGQSQILCAFPFEGNSIKWNFEMGGLSKILLIPLFR